MNVANVLFITATILAALSQSTTLFIAARTLTGLAVASNVLNPAIVGDIFVSEQRGSAMSLIQLAPLIGGAVGPAISGAIAETMGWRSTMWMCVILATTCEVIFLTFFRETYKVAILRRKAARLRVETGNTSLRTVFDADDGSRSEKLWGSIVRPFTVLAGSGVLQMLSVFGSITFTYFYILVTTLPEILETLYSLSPAGAGSALISFSRLRLPLFYILGVPYTNLDVGVGSAISVVICNQTLDRIYIKLRDHNKGVGQPEYRLPLVIVGGFTLPLVAAWYGWNAQLRVPIVLLLLSVAIMGITLMLGFFPLYAYVVDAFGLYAASAMTAVIVTRCLAGTFLPLATAPLVDRFGYGIGLSILGAASFVLAPIPVLVLRYGSKWRQGSKYTRDA
ncbi:hypothetical protein PC116_g28665 [Phytophthora cactorum]|nr:hypothetical protein PC116_g28665 [Phytophthora cactorum]